MGGLPWWSSGEDSARLLQGTKVQSLVEEIRSCMLYGVAKKKKPWHSPTPAVNFGWGMETTDSTGQYYNMSWSAGL